MGALDGLDAEQRAAVTSEAAPLCILAGPGSGKTRTLTRRIAHRAATGSAAPEHALAVTFTRKAAGELRSRLAALGVRDVAAGTFHAVAWAQLRQRWADRGERTPTILDRPTRLLPPHLVAEVAWAKARMLDPAGYAAAAPASGRTPSGSIAEAAAAYERYEQEKRRRGLVDLDDLVVRCVEALESDPAFAAAQRWRFRHLFVDELQDVSPAQFRLLRGWLGDGSDLCVVGDPEQAVYAWNGADPSFLTRFRDHFPSAEIVELTANHRSTPQVVAAASAVSASPRRSAAGRPDGPPPTVRRFDTGGDEAVAVARGVRDAHRPGAPWSHIAVLARTNAQLPPLAAALDAAGVPHRAGAPALLDRPEVKAALEGLRRLPPQSLLASHAADIDALARRLGRRYPERRDNLRELAGLAAELAAVRPGATVEELLGWLPAAGTDAPAGEDAVSLLTFHRAKGLEWPVVFVTGLEEGLVPIAHAAGAEQLAEERRLLYVALTRALDELHCSWAARRTFGAYTADRTPSPWLAAVETSAGAAAARRPADWRRRLAEVRSSLPS